jgi:hypothetical protein
VAYVECGYRRSRAIRLCIFIADLDMRRLGEKGRSFSLKKLLPNLSLNADAPVRVFSLASLCGGAPVTLDR